MSGISAENASALALADELRWVLQDNPDAGHRAMIKAVTLTLAGLLIEWPAETREFEADCAINVLLAAVEEYPDDGETVQ
jgi:hypothetical protein